MYTDAGFFIPEFDSSLHQGRFSPVSACFISV